MTNTLTPWARAREVEKQTMATSDSSCATRRLRAEVGEPERVQLRDFNETAAVIRTFSLLNGPPATPCGAIPDLSRDAAAPETVVSRAGLPRILPQVSGKPRRLLRRDVSS